MMRLADRPANALVSVVLPAHDEEEALPSVVAAIVAAVAPSPFEIVVVDDGGTDGTWRQVQLLRQAHPTVRGLRFTRNFGHQSAILAGLLAARGDAVIVMDADGQHPPELIPVFLERWREGYQVVQAIRTTGTGAPNQESLFPAVLPDSSQPVGRRRTCRIGRLPAAW